MQMSTPWTHKGDNVTTLVLIGKTVLKCTSFC